MASEKRHMGENYGDAYVSNEKSTPNSFAGRLMNLKVSPLPIRKPWPGLLFPLSSPN